MSTPAPPTWDTVAPLLARWQIALIPAGENTWEVYAGYPGGLWPQATARAVPWAAVPCAIADVARRCQTQWEARA